MVSKFHQDLDGEWQQNNNFKGWGDGGVLGGG